MASKTQAQVRNGVKAPIRGICRITWDLFDTATAPVLAQHLPRVAEETGLNLTNLRIELSRYNRFNGKSRKVH